VVAQIFDRIVVDRENPQVRAIIPATYAESGAVGEREAAESGPEILDEFADHAALAQHLRHGEHEVGRGDAFLELAVEAHGRSLPAAASNRAAEHRGFRFVPPTPQPSTARPFTIVVCESVPTSVSG